MLQTCSRPSRLAEHAQAGAWDERKVQEMDLCKAEALESGCGHAHAAMRVEDDVQGASEDMLVVSTPSLTSVT